MLKLISTSSARCFSSSTTRIICRASFCSDSSSNGEEAEVKLASDSSDSSNKTSHTVLVNLFQHRPLFPGFHKQLFIQDPVLLAALRDIKLCGRKEVYCGSFLLTDDFGNDPNVRICPESGDIYGRPRKNILPYLHNVGTLSKIIDLSNLEHPVIHGLRRVRITEMVSDYPVVVKVEVLEDKSYEDDNALKATSTEVMSTLADVMKMPNLRTHHLTTMFKHSGEFNYSRLADFGAEMSSASKQKCQQVLEELDVQKRLNLTLELLKKDVNVSKLQESIRKAAEEKVKQGMESRKQ